ncbi:glycosyltransferase [Desulfovibrio aerotolerans]|uniref:Glycosyltransferase n=1 Tax=Solidesulfovibrio aerotolerans TaxID=295255 RepID=A0A7C9IVW1_9BACT|nr:glycosyltransferase family 4 protein [Solidesulfovibrio aerotolerans]MYL83062.1 glycosyltransferase [Solidesulfovibrio aerotolerans]
MRAQRIFGTLDPFVESDDVMGRKVANAAFLDALMRADPYDAYHFFMPSRQWRDRQEGLLAARYPQVAQRGAFKVLTRQELPHALADTDYAVFHLSDCITAQARLAAARNALARSIFPITGTTHSLSNAVFQRDFLAHLWPGTTRRDAIVATSTAGLGAVEAIFASLRRGYGLSPEDYPAPELALIPLGVDPADWTRLDGEARRAARDAFGIAPETAVLLVFGRISHSSKMDLLPLFRAVQRLIAAGVAAAGLTLVVAGWTDTDTDDDPFLTTLANLAANIGLSLVLIRRPAEAAKQALFGLADVFVSLADNPQETFGLTLLEAMAAGLPVVASDYDGYRDIVVHGRTGWLLPTLGPVETGLRDVLAPLCYDNHTHLRLAQSLAVDVPALAQALLALIREPQLRQTMGLAGKQRATELFTWDACLARHLALWERLAGAPVPDRALLARTPHPLTLAYGEVFAGYPGGQLGDGVRLTWSRAGLALYNRQDFPVIYAELDKEIRPDALRILVFLARSGCPGLTLAKRLAAAVPGLSGADAAGHVLWALKHDLLEKEHG